ncbi:glycosyltransferase family 2 protein [Rhodovarius crocodyli]|uniref:Glycosyltransferase family 2 protein n=1 Tax=Rhodovarius crocodyli TaxID=1979269 RepID=A0A437MIT1_9PROT|nr:glycosyltransferase [Rhodovarius crocodyli]RVT97550.1 glycosyltransferase family 2 protein [Rhodovarius crocodyli]
MTRFSLVVATMGRDADIAVLLDSVLAQAWPDVEIIIVDQNKDNRVAPVVAAYEKRLPIIHIRTPRPHANAARNLGLGRAGGDVVAFPDDDCILPPGTLSKVARTMEHEGADVLTGPSASPAGGLGSGRWQPESAPITLRNVWTSVIEFNLWLKRGVAVALGGFDEKLGPGSVYGSAEGNDLVARAIAAGHRCWYERPLEVIHPDKRLTDVATARAYTYGAGLGVVLARHRPPFMTWFAFFWRPLVGVAVSLLRGRRHHAGYYWQTFRGRLAGFRAQPGLDGAA